MSLIALNVISLDTAVKYLGADSSKVEELIVKGHLDCNKIENDYVLDEQQFTDLERVVIRNNYRSSYSDTISVYDLESFCIEKGYVPNEKVFNSYLDEGLFKDYKVTHPFTGMVTYRKLVLAQIASASERGSIITLKNEGYTKTVVLKKLGINSNKFMELTKMLQIKPRTFISTPIYSQDQLLSLVKLNKMLTSYAKSKSTSSSSDAIFRHENNDYISKENVRLYLGTKYGTVVYLTSLGAISYKQIVYNGAIVTAVLKNDLDLIRSCISKDYKPSVIALVLSGFLSEEEVDKYIFRSQFFNILKELDLPFKRLNYILDEVIKPDITVQGVKLFSKAKLHTFIKKFVRNTYNVKDLSPNFIDATRLAELIGRSPKNIKSYALKYLDNETEVYKSKWGYAIDLNAYLSKQNNRDVEVKLDLEEQRLLNRVNIV